MSRAALGLVATRIVLAVCAAALGVAGAGCDNLSFDAVTAPPPTRTATLDDREGVITLSRGVALAFDCTYKYNGSCGAGNVSVRDTDIATAFVGYGGALHDADRSSQQRGPGDQPPTRFVVFGGAPGSTTLDVDTACGGARFEVIVLDD